ncbi:hypothetical protein C0992_006070 [Termitomyces sp. T32_za158]|nr:hypothetical protein C0992_006070 [Termitomyces sp. T32_za158]
MGNNISLTDSALAYLYLTTSDNFDKYSSDDTYLTTLPNSSCPAALGLTKARNCTSDLSNNLSTYVTAPKWKGVQVKKKYKPVALKTKPVASSVSEDFRIEQKIIGDPLADMPPLIPNPPPFVPTGRFTDKRRKQFLADHDKGFLTATELDILTDLMAKQNKAFAWEDSERGSLCTNLFPPVVIPTIPHIPWTKRNQPIPPGLEVEVCQIIRSKIKAGVYEPSNSAYHSRWFCVLKKNGSLRITTLRQHEPMGSRYIDPSDPPTDTIDDDIFEDWIDRLHGFMHLIQLPTRLLHADRPLNTLLHPIKPYRPIPFQTQPTFFTKLLTDTFTQNLLTDLKRIEEPTQLRDSSTDLMYNAVPQSAKAQAMDSWLKLVKIWLDNLKQPHNLTNNQYSNFI